VNVAEVGVHHIVHCDGSAVGQAGVLAVLCVVHSTLLVLRDGFDHLPTGAMPLIYELSVAIVLDHPEERDEP
jgi:hypothetical protein